MNWLLIVVIGIIVIGALVGLARGAVRISISLVAAIVTLIVVFFATPYVSKAIKDLTPVDEVVERQCFRMMTRLSGGDDKGELTEERVRYILAGSGISEETLESHGITVEDIVEGKVTAQDMADLGISTEIWKGHMPAPDKDVLMEVEISRQDQIRLIEESRLPNIFKELLLSNNNNEVYERLGAVNFVDYLAKYMTDMILHLVAFLLTFLIVHIFMRAIIFALDFVAELPVLGFFNHLLGMGIGAIIGIMLVDLLLMALTLLFAAEVGGNLNRMVSDSELLTFLYNNNYLMKLATRLR